MEQVVIDRTNWYRGKRSQHSRLLRTDGQMCCLGFKCLTDGWEREQILNKGFMSQAPVSSDLVRRVNLPSRAQDLLTNDYRDTLAALHIAAVNDTPVGENTDDNGIYHEDPVTIESEAHREALIADLFQKYFKQEVIFVN